MPYDDPRDTEGCALEISGNAATEPIGAGSDASRGPAAPSSPEPGSHAFLPPGGIASGAPRYEMQRVLGAGGMGEVHLCRDARIGREVAMKVARPTGRGPTSEARERFLREARVQGQLEHPSVVPVYDIGNTGSGETFFTMKRIGGHTLAEIVSGLRSIDAEITPRYSRRKLLGAMSQVCLTVAYAHSRGVVHRDLKPSNVMLGDFGEVYVLDWGVAKVSALAADGSSTSVPEGSAGPMTQAGALLGTPGYIAPEQVRGAAASPASDVYALGAILFELLALEPLHRGDTIGALTLSTMAPAPLPSERAPAAHIAPELDAICARALELDPGARFAGARAMQEAIEAFLDGERDAERRRELASEHLKKARQALARASQRGGDAEAHRVEGMRELGRAVALDPSDEGALRTITEIVLAPAGDLPPDALAEASTAERRDRAGAASRAARMYAVWLVFTALLLVMGVRSWAAFAVLVALVVAAGVSAWWIGSTPERAVPARLGLWMGLNFALVAAVSCIFGPFIFAPGVAASSAAAFVLAIREKSALRRMPFLLAMFSVFVPLGLSYLGVLPRAYTFHDGVVTVHPFVAAFDAVPTFLTLSLVTFAQLVLPSVLISRAVDALVDAERRNFAQAWRLRQLLPRAGRVGSSLLE
jgi:serine/threonine protein kinase